MPAQVWGDLAKSQVDDETIEEAIARVVQEHDDDETSHLETGESLQSHKASEIIDHIAESVVNDKIQPMARSSVAIVDSAGFGDFTDIQEAIDFADSRGGGSIYIRAGIYYPPASLYLTKGIDLVGDGMSESIIDFSSADRCIFSYEKFQYSSYFADSAHFVNGSKIVTAIDGFDLETAGIFSGMYICDFGNAGVMYEIDTVDSPSQLTMKDNYTGATGDYEAEVGLAGSYTHNLSVVTFPSNVDLYSVGIEPLMNITCADGDDTDFIIVSVDSAYQLTLSGNYTGTTGVYFVYIYAPIPPAHRIEHLTLRNSAADYFVNAGVLGSCCDIYSVKFSSGHGLYLHDLGSICHQFSNNVFDNCAFAYLIDSPSCKVLFNNGSFSQANSTFMFTYSSSVCAYNIISGNSLSGSSIFYLYGGYFPIIGNKFGLFDNFSVNNNSCYGLMINSNEFDFNAAKNCTLNLGNSAISNNLFYTSGIGRVVLPAGCNYNSFIGNHVSFTITNLGTGNEVAHNPVS